jgi:hypothetical protein
MPSAEYQRAWRKKNPTKYRKYKATWRRKNREAACSAQMAWRKKNPAKVRLQNRWSHYRIRYGLTKTEYARLRKEGCWLCGNPFETKEIPDVDHDHTTNKFRGLAHALCNRAIGMVGDSAAMLYKLAKSLEDYEARQKTELQ